MHVLRVKRMKRHARVTVSTKKLHAGKVRYRIRLSNGKSILRARTFRPACPSH